MNARRVTISDVATRAKVSKTAVSFAFNDPSKLSEGTLQQILSAADELGYVRDPAARMLRTRRTNSLGVLLPQQIDSALENPYYTQFFRGVGHTCHQEGLSMLLVPPLRGSMLKAIPYAAVDGFIVCGLETDRGEVQALRSRGIPFVLVDSDETDGVSYIDVDEQEGMRDVAQYVLSQGHRRILVLAFESGTTGGPTGWHGPLSRRKQGFDEALAAYDVAADDPRVEVREIPCTRAAGAAALRDVWLNGERPTAVLAFSDIIAFGVLDAAHELGIDVPRELSVTGFDDLPESEWAHPGLTTARQPIEAKGRLAAEYLVDAIAAQDHEPHRRRLHATLVVRSSVTVPPKTSAEAPGREPTAQAHR